MVNIYIYIYICKYKNTWILWDEPNIETASDVFCNEQLPLPETNIAPEKLPSQKKTSIPTIHFQVPSC